MTDPWSHTFDATTYTPRCPQLYGPSGYSGDEDCLHMNIYTPIVSVSNKFLKSYLPIKHQHLEIVRS